MKINRVYYEELKKVDYLLWLAVYHHKTHKKKKLTFKDHQFLIDIYKDKHPYQVIIKSTQAGVSEYELVRTISHALKGMNVFVVFPTDVLVSRFVNGRFNKSLQYTQYYRTLQKQIKEKEDKRTDSMRMIDIGDGNVCYVGSNSEANFTEYPADEVIIEELDQCDLNNIKMAKERLSHSDYRYQLLISNPTYEGMAIDEEFNNTDQHEWFVKADCGHLVNIDWFQHIVKQVDSNRYIIRDWKWTRNSRRDINPVCNKCNKPVNRRNPGKWIAQKSEKSKRGRRVTKLFSGTTSIIEMMDRFLKGLTNDAEQQRFFNADLGKAFTPEGSKITRQMIQGCVGNYAPGPEKGINIAGIDIGTFYNFIIASILSDGRLKTIYIGKERDTSQVILKLKEYYAIGGVVDGMYEVREARKIASAFKLMFLCYFAKGKKDIIDPRARTITVNRTSTLDVVKEALLLKSILFPRNTMSHEEFLNQMTASTRVVNKEVKNNKTVASVDWVEGSKADHWFLATGYLYLAKKLVILLNQR